MTPTDTSQNAADFWEDRYGSGALNWSGRVNDLLAPEVEGLTPGHALDLGCGTGGDAIWLAARGWQVTAVDIAQAAIDQARGHAADAQVSDRITWQRHDFEASFPRGEFDLVSACYLQSPVPFQRIAALRSATSVVAPGGRLVVVSHESAPAGSARHHAVSMPTAPELFVDLKLADGDWELVKAESVPRSREVDGKAVSYRDNVLHLRRR